MATTITIPDFIFPKNLYKDLTYQATLHHITLTQEIINRLTTVLTPEYKKYMNTNLYKEKIILNAHALYYLRNIKNNDKIKKYNYIFDFKMSSRLSEVLHDTLELYSTYPYPYRGINHFIYSRRPIL